jgi:zinc-finger of a C2HC-type
VFIEQRKAFDSKKMRIADNPELVQILKKKEKEENVQKKKPGKVDVPIAPAEGMPKWKQQSSQFREALRAARMYSNAAAKGEELPPPIISAPDTSLVPCPHCAQRFNEKAAERHIPQCLNIRAKPSVLRKGAGGGGGLQGSTVAATKAAVSQNRPKPRR